MSIFDNIKNYCSAAIINHEYRKMCDPRAESIIRAQERGFQKSKQFHPHYDTHRHLAEVWLARMVAHGVDIRDDSMQHMAFMETLTFACLPEEESVKALGLYFVCKECPEVIERNSIYVWNFKRLMAPILEINKNDFIDLYCKKNPKSAEGLGFFD